MLVDSRMCLEKEITIDNWSEHYEYDPEDHISIMFGGDTGDSIPGVQGIGPKRRWL